MKFVKKRNRFYFDMDGVLAVWDKFSTKADTHVVGYFLKRALDFFIKEIILRLIAAGEEVIMLTAVYTDGKAAEEKRTWLNQMGLAHVPMIAVPYGSPKHLFIDADPNVNHILIDDYTVNLKEWVMRGKNFVAVKFLNGINGTKGTWFGPVFSRAMSAEAVVYMLQHITDDEQDVVPDVLAKLNSVFNEAEVKNILKGYYGAHFRHASRESLTRLSCDIVNGIEVIG